MDEVMGAMLRSPEDRKDKRIAELEAKLAEREWVSVEDRPLLMEVFIHSHADTGKPLSVDVFEVNGKMHMQWFYEVFEQNNDVDLAELFYEHLQKVDDAAWFYVKPMVEVLDAGADYYLEVTGMSATPENEE